MKIKTVRKTSFVNLGLPMISGRRKESSVVLLIFINLAVGLLDIYICGADQQAGGTT
jgi:hypothetical protein